MAKNHSTKRRQKKNRKLRDAARKRGPIKAQKAGCPTPYKKSFISRAEAQKYIQWTWRSPNSQQKTVLTRSYMCPCGMWHTSSNKNPNYQKSVQI